MKKLIFVPIILLSIYCIAWFGVASFIEHKVDSVLGTLKNDKVQILGGHTVKVSGFPFDFSLKLSKPRFHFIDNNKTSLATYDVIFNGDFKLSISWLLKSIDLVSNGGISIIGIVDGYKFNINANAEKDTEYKIVLHDTPLWGKGLQIMLSLGDHPENALKLIKKILIKSTKCHINSIDSNQLIFAADTLKLDLGIDFHDKNPSKFSIKQTIGNAQFTSASMVLWRHLRNASIFKEMLEGINPEVSKYFATFTLPQLGKMNYFVDLDYQAKKDSASFDLKINKLHLQDSVMEVKLDGYISTDLSNLELDLKNDSKFSNNWYQLMTQYVQTLHTSNEFNSRKALTKLSIFGVIIEKLKSTFVGNNVKVYVAYIPKLQEFGWISNQVKLSTKSNNDKSEFDVTIQNLTFKIDPYSITMHGNTSQRKDKQSFDIKLALNGYGLIINDVFTYAQRISNAIGRKLFIGSAALDLSQHSRFEIQSFIKQISDEPNANSINLNLTTHKSYNDAYPKVGGYNSQAFGLLWNKLIATVVLNETIDKINKVQKILPTELQDKLGNQIEKKLSPLRDLLSQLN